MSILGTFDLFDQIENGITTEQLTTILSTTKGKSEFVGIFQYDDLMERLVDNDVLFAFITNNTSAMTAIVGSEIAMTAIVGSEMWMTAIVGSEMWMTAIVGSEMWMTAIVGSEMWMTAIVGSEIAMTAIVGSEMWMTAIENVATDFTGNTITYNTYRTINGLAGKRAIVLGVWANSNSVVNSYGRTEHTTNGEVLIQTDALGTSYSRTNGFIMKKFNNFEFKTTYTGARIIYAKAIVYGDA